MSSRILGFMAISSIGVLVECTALWDNLAHGFPGECEPFCALKRPNWLYVPQIYRQWQDITDCFFKI